MSKFSILDEYAPGEEAAETLHICTRSLTRYAAEPGSEIRSLKIGGRRYYLRESIKRELKRRERQAPARRTAAQPRRLRSAEQKESR